MVSRTLCIGNNTEDTDQQASRIAKESHSANRGLLSDLDGPICFDSRIQDPGIYHTSFVDLSFERVKQVIDYFDRILLLDQPIDRWNTTTEFYDTINYAMLLESRIEWQNDTSKKNLQYWQHVVETNSSICIWPFTQMSFYDSHATLCCISDKKLDNTIGVDDFHGTTYRQIRDAMISGQRLDHCDACYKLEARGIKSARQQQTLEWVTRLNLATMQDLGTIDSPISLEIHLDNKCNLQCRMCGPAASSLIEKEYTKLGIMNRYPEFVVNPSKRNLDEFLAIDNLQKIYFTGGEPTANARVYDFLDHCVAKNKTDFVLQINTNAWKISDKLVSLIKKFRKAEFIVSIDAFGRANDYIRWPSRWNMILANASKLDQIGTVSFAVSLSLYGIFSFTELMEFLDRNYPGKYVHCQFVENQSPFMIAYDPQQIEKIEQIRHMSIYRNNPALQSFVNGLIADLHQSTLQKQSLQEFFVFNDRLDASRGSRLQDYIPELCYLRNLL